MKSIKEIVEEIMQSGFDVAMGGDAFLSEEENKTAQEIKYDEFVKIYTNKIRKLISRSIKKRDEELKKELDKAKNYYLGGEEYPHNDREAGMFWMYQAFLDTISNKQDKPIKKEGEI